MKYKLMIPVLLLMLVLSACVQPGAAAPVLNVNDSVQPQGSQSAGTTDIITVEEAKNIALTHAGFTAEQVSGLRVEFEYDDGIPEYSVDFREGYLEYEYEIHAKTGQILSFEKDD